MIRLAVLVTYDSAPKIAHSYDLPFIDESGQAMVGHLLSILARQQCLLKVALVGDDKQLPTFTQAGLWTQSNITDTVPIHLFNQDLAGFFIT